MSSLLKAESQMKVCRTCKIEKPMTDYSKHKDYSDGRFHICKKCLYEAQKRREAEKKKNDIDYSQFYMPI